MQEYDYNTWNRTLFHRHHKMLTDIIINIYWKLLYRNYKKLTNLWKTMSRTVTNINTNIHKILSQTMYKSSRTLRTNLPWWVRGADCVVEVQWGGFHLNPWNLWCYKQYNKHNRNKGFRWNLYLIPDISLYYCFTRTLNNARAIEIKQRNCSVDQNLIRGKEYITLLWLLSTPGD